MRFDLLVPTILKFLFKLSVFILSVFVLMNIVFTLYNFPLLNQLASLVQESVRKNGYLPSHDRDEIQKIMEMYTKNKDYSGNTGIPGVNRIITNLRIQVFDIDGNGYSIDENTLHSYSYGETDNFPGDTDYYIGETGKEHKKQQGSVLFAGISCDYLILTPLNGWDVFKGFGSDSSQLAQQENVAGELITTDNWFMDDNTNDDDETQQNKIADNGLKYNTLTFNNASHSLEDRSLFISPVITTEYYPDLENLGD